MDYMPRSSMIFEFSQSTLLPSTLHKHSSYLNLLNTLREVKSFCFGVSEIKNNVKIEDVFTDSS